MDDDFLEPATRAVLAMVAALLIHQSEEFSRKLCQKYREFRQPDTEPELPTIVEADNFVLLPEARYEEPPEAVPSAEIQDISDSRFHTLPLQYQTPLQPRLQPRTEVAEFQSPFAPPMHSSQLEVPEESFTRTPVPDTSSYRRGIRDASGYQRFYTPPAPPSIRMIRTPPRVSPEPLMIPQRRPPLQRRSDLQSTQARRVLYPNGATPPASPSGSIAYRTPQGYQVMSPDEVGSFHMARRQYPLHRGGYVEQSPARSFRASSATPAPADQSESFRIARRAPRQLPISLLESLPSFAGSPAFRARRSPGYREDTTFGTPESRRGIAFPELSQAPPTLIGSRIAGDSTVLSDAETPYTPRSQGRLVRQTGGETRRRRRPENYSPVMGQSYVGPPVRSPRRILPLQQSRYEENLDDVELELAPDLSASGYSRMLRTSTPLVPNTAASVAVFNIHEALRVLNDKINHQLEIIGAGGQLADQDRVGILRRDSDDFDFETGRMRDR